MGVHIVCCVLGGKYGSGRTAAASNAQATQDAGETVNQMGGWMGGLVMFLEARVGQTELLVAVHMPRKMGGRVCICFWG